MSESSNLATCVVADCAASEPPRVPMLGLHLNNEPTSRFFAPSTAQHLDTDMPTDYLRHGPVFWQGCGELDTQIASTDSWDSGQKFVPHAFQHDSGIGLSAGTELQSSDVDSVYCSGQCESILPQSNELQNSQNILHSCNNSGAELELQRQLQQLRLSESQHQHDQYDSSFTDSYSSRDMEQLSPQPVRANTSEEEKTVAFGMVQAVWQEAFAQDEDGDSKLHLVVIHLRPELVEQILYVAPSPAYLDLQNQHRQTPLHLAVLTQQPTVIRLLLLTGAALDIHDLRGDTPLHIACKNGDLECIQALTTPPLPNELVHCHRQQYPPSYHAIPQDMRIKNYEGQSCLHLAASEGQRDVISYLLHTCAADVNDKEGKSGRTILHMAAEAGDEALINDLLASTNLDLEAQTYDGCTAVKLAASRSHPNIVNLLLSAGANKDTLGSDLENWIDDDDPDVIYDDVMINMQPVTSR